MSAGGIENHDRTGFGAMGQARNWGGLLPGNDVFRRLLGGINPPPPRVRAGLQFNDAVGSGLLRPVEEQQLRAGRGAGEPDEVRAAALERGAQRMAAAAV